MYRIFCYVVLLAIFVGSNGYFIDHIKPCPLKDYDCQKKLVQGSLKYLAKGLPEYNVPPLDPLVVKNLTFKMLDAIEMKVVEGIVKGTKDCTVNKMKTLLEKNKAIVEITCDINVKAKYKASSKGGAISVFGGPVNGDGTGKAKIEKMNVKMELKYKLVKRPSDGEIIIKADLNDLKYTYDIGKAAFSISNIFVGETDISKFVTDFLNQNWKFLFSQLAKPAVDVAINYAYDNVVHPFLDGAPLRYFISDDLNQYLDD